MKNQAIKKHKLVILSLMMQDLCEDLERDNIVTPEFKKIIEKTKELGDLSQQFLESINDVKDVTSTTYFQEIMNKIDTIFRKNFIAMN